MEVIKAVAPVLAKASWFSIKPATFTARIGIQRLTTEKFFSSLIGRGSKALFNV
jgi:hypothetical protein